MLELQKSKSVFGSRLSHIWYVFILQDIALFLFIPSARQYPTDMLQMATLQRSGNEVFPFTYISAAGLFVFAFLSLRKKTSFPKALILAIAFPFAATGFFEQVYQTIGYFELGPSTFWAGLGLLIDLSFILLILSSVEFWSISKTFYILLATFFAGFVVWSAIGFPQIYGTNPQIALAFNVPLKVLSYILFASLLGFNFRGSKISQRQRFQNRS
ncbi:MAG: hypothetical protein OK439_01425 [Thaumarchaeota archaeon]|nr:hypothetical protein [Nitrososphaerota archaeon]